MLAGDATGQYLAEDDDVRNSVQSRERKAFFFESGGTILNLCPSRRAACRAACHATCRAARRATRPAACVALPSPHHRVNFKWFGPRGM